MAVVWTLSAIYPSKRSNAQNARPSLTFDGSHHGVRQRLRAVYGLPRRLGRREKIEDSGEPIAKITGPYSHEIPYVSALDAVGPHERV